MIWHARSKTRPHLECVHRSVDMRWALQYTRPQVIAERSLLLMERQVVIVLKVGLQCNFSDQEENHGNRRDSTGCNQN